jgi:hypothetical protein
MAKARLLLDAAAAALLIVFVDSAARIGITASLGGIFPEATDDATETAAA